VKQQLVLTDTTTPTAATSAATSVTQTGSPVFYRRDGGTPVAPPPMRRDSHLGGLDFALQVGSEAARVFVHVASKDYNTGGDATAWKKTWLADITAAIKTAMVAAGQLQSTDAAVVTAKFIGGQLLFDSAKTLTIWTDTTPGSATPSRSRR